MPLFRKALLASGALISLAAAVPALAQNPMSATPARYQHVLLISIDGMHGIDLQNYISDPAHADSTLTKLAARGVIYQNAYTTAPSDSFPGMIAQATGATPLMAGVFYDDSYDRTLFAPGSNCQGSPGTETNYAENIDKDSTRLDAGGTLGQPLTQTDQFGRPAFVECIGQLSAGAPSRIHPRQHAVRGR